MTSTRQLVKIYNTEHVLSCALVLVFSVIKRNARPNKYITRYGTIAYIDRVRLTLWYVHVHTSVHLCSTCRYVRLNALNVLHIHGPCFHAPLYQGFHYVQISKGQHLMRYSLPHLSLAQNVVRVFLKLTGWRVACCFRVNSLMDLDGMT